MIQYTRYDTVDNSMIQDHSVVCLCHTVSRGGPHEDVIKRCIPLAVMKLLQKCWNGYVLTKAVNNQVA